ncbi:MAG: hypothetical protein ACI4MT_02240 [Christensenellales bacterium]
MECRKCKKDVEFLTLFDGSLVCPECKNKIIDDHFIVTKENDELFKMSEILYLNAIKANDRKTFKELISKATELCFKAVGLGHPKAVLKIGFYYSHDYIERSRSKSERARYASFYYKVLFMSPSESCDVETDVDGFANDAFLKLKEEAAKQFIEMIENLPAENSVFYEKEIAYVLNKYHIVKKDAYVESEMAVSPVKVLKSCYGDFHTPLFGMFRMTKKNFCENAEDIASKLGDGKIQACIVHTNLAGRLCFTNKELNFSNILAYAKDWAEQSDENKRENDCFMFFVNRVGKHKFSAKKRKGIYSVLNLTNGNADETLLGIIKRLYVKCVNNRCDYIFTDDDLLAQTALTEREALKSVIEKI